MGKVTELDKTYKGWPILEEMPEADKLTMLPDRRYTAMCLLQLQESF